MHLVRKQGFITRTYRHLNRYRQIIGVLFKYGLADLREQRFFRLGSHAGTRQERAKFRQLSRPKRIRLALEELGPTFVKLGQLLSTRPDLIPLDYLNELSALQDHVSPFPYEQVRTTIYEDLGEYPEELFVHFEKSALGSASIAQVHKARLKSGIDVVVKVQRPKIREKLDIDLEIISYVLSLAKGQLKEMNIHNPDRILKHFSESVDKELNFDFEESHIHRFSRQFAHDSTVYVPKLYTDYCSHRVLTMEYIDGIKASNIERLTRESYDLSTIAVRGVNLTMKQIFDFGFFHADPHPGNIFVLPDNVLCFIDFGMMGRISVRDRETFAALIDNLVNRNDIRLVDSLIKLTNQEAIPKRDDLERHIGELIDQHLYKPLRSLEIGRLLNQLITVLSRHGLSLKPDMFLMIKALTAVEMLSRKLQADFELVEHAESYLRRARLRKLNPQYFVDELREAGADVFRLLKVIPGEFREILQYARKGEVKFQFEHQGLDSFIHTNEQISNRIAFAIVLASLIIGSSLMVHADIPPRWQGIPVIGLVGFIVAGVMGFWLLVTIIRHGRM